MAGAGGASGFLRAEGAGRFSKGGAVEGCAEGCSDEGTGGAGIFAAAAGVNPPDNPCR